MDNCGPFEVMVDTRGHVLGVGTRLAALAGVAPSELIGRAVSRFLRGPALTGSPGVAAALELRADGRAPIAGTGVRSVDGGRLSLTFVPEAARSDGGRARESEPRLAEVGREIQDALTGIIGFAGLVPIAPTPHRRKFYIDQVVSQAERVRRLVHIYDPSLGARAVAEGPLPLSRPADVGAELAHALSGLRASLERGGVGFDIELPHEPVWASCDIRQVGDLVSALIQRATVQQRRDYQANEVVLRVRRGASPHALIELTLTGADQPQALMRERFGTDDEESHSPAMSEMELRAGIAALRRQGGQITVAVDQAREEVKVALSLSISAPPRRADKLRTPVPLDVLVVDDDAMLGELYQEMLQVAGHSVTSCRTISAAREALRAQRFDAVVAEFQMKDGLLSELWAMASEAHPELMSRLVVATRDPRDPRLIEWAMQGQTPILAKPFSAPALLEQLALLV